ncbi:MAG TPA: DUF2797 domain-containing protein [Gammaproteobacteria bacterium]|nr:DUF2797 domain-containing protein [Gammaproteobacteria bacterium]
MSFLTGKITKMSVELTNPVTYHFHLGEEKILANSLLGEKIRFRFTGEIRCIQCDRKISKSFQQGFCFPCFKRLNECNLCNIHPEKCRFYEGVCNNDDWAHAHCGKEHAVYLANSSGIKVGITRNSHIPSRWIDQGASQGLVIARVQNRYQSGLVEVAIKQYVADKTNWRAMLKSENSIQNLTSKREELLTLAKSKLSPILERFSDDIQFVSSEEATRIHYPILEYPKKITTFDLDKNPVVEGTLLGLKGQYLILDTGVILVRKFAGYCLQWG